MSILSLRTAIVAKIALDASMISLGLRTCETHEGQFTTSDITKVSKASPAIITAFLSLNDIQNNGGSITTTLKFASFIITRGTSQVLRDAQSLLFLQALVTLIEGNSWGIADASSPKDISATNLHNDFLRKSGASLVVVTWSQDLDLGVVDLTDYEDFETFAHDVDMAPADDQIDIQGLVENLEV